MLPLFLFAAASADSAVIEEIVITALKRETTLRDTPLAISAEAVSVNGLSIPLFSQGVLPGYSGDAVGAWA